MNTVLQEQSSNFLAALWTNVLESVKTELNNEQSFLAFFSKMELLDVQNNTAFISVPTAIHGEFVEHSYSKLLITMYNRNATRKIDSLQFKAVQEVLYPTYPQPQAPSNATNITIPPIDINKKSSTVIVNEKQFYPNYRFENFVVGPSDEIAYQAALSVAEAPGITSFNPLVIYGKTGLGKTHLLQAIGHFAQEEGTAQRIYYISAFDFLSRFVAFILEKKDVESFYTEFANVDLLLIDDIHFLSKKTSTQQAFYRIFSTLINMQKQIVLTSDRLPDEIPDMQEGLLNRFKGGLLVEIEAPTLKTRMDILERKANTDNIQLSKEVISYMASRVTNNVRMLEGIFTKVLASTIFNNKELTLETVQEILNDFEQGQKSRVTIEIIQEKVAAFYEVSANQLRAHTRKREISYPRSVAMHLSRNLTKQSLRTIGLQFGGRDYSTVIHASNKVEKEMEISSTLKSEVEQLKALILDA